MKAYEIVILALTIWWPDARWKRVILQTTAHSTLHPEPPKPEKWGKAEISETRNPREHEICGMNRCVEFFLTPFMFSILSRLCGDSL
jgi:hypothetical protein